jgi:hypothetical protein
MVFIALSILLSRRVPTTCANRRGILNVVAFLDPQRDEYGRELCARCGRANTRHREEWDFIDNEPVCPGCITYSEGRMLNARRRLAGQEERPVGPVPPAL